HAVRRPTRRRPDPLSRRRSSPPRGAAMNTLQEVVAALERAQLLVEMPDLHTWPEITGLTADSRKVERGMLYCAVHGSARDGHEFVAAARERGAAAALVEREQGVEVPQILVRDGRRAAAVAAEAWYDRPAAKLDLVGVTGTNGKTTSVTLLRHVLSALEPTGSIGTLGAFDPTGEPVPSEAGNLTTPGPIDLQATLAALVARGARGAPSPGRAPRRGPRPARASRRPRGGGRGGVRAPAPSRAWREARGDAAAGGAGLGETRGGGPAAAAEARRAIARGCAGRMTG